MVSGSPRRPSSARAPASADGRRRRRRRATVGAAVVVVPFTLLVGLLWAFQRSLIYLPDDGPVGAADAQLPGARDVTLTTGDGLELGAWYLPGPDADAPAVLV